VHGRIEVLSVDLPGRGKRRSERCVEEWPELSAMLASELAPQLREPYALLGYSLGALVALSVAHEITSRRDSIIPFPKAFVACALRGPKIIECPRHLHRMEDRAMFEALRGLGGVPDEFLASQELIALAAPSMRADLRLLETYVPKGKPLRRVPVHAYYGRNDNSVGADFAAWRDETEVAFHSRAFAGGHMFIHDDASAFADALVADLVDNGSQRKSA
jgi:surfactin synthase thioesterase subunit